VRVVAEAVAGGRAWRRRRAGAGEGGRSHRRVHRGGDPLTLDPHPASRGSSAHGEGGGGQPR
jgi:hypothetical protein